jgi:hypothetical protein
MNPHEFFTGNVISVANKALSLTPVIFGNYQIRWNGATDRIEIATLSGTAQIDFSTAINYGLQSTTINGAGGIDASIQGTPLALNTTFAAIGDLGIVGIEHRRIHIWDALNHYIVNIQRKGTTAIDGWCDFYIEKIGISTNNIYSAGNGLILQNGTFLNPNKISKSSPIASAQNGTLISMGEFDFRYSLNATNGNLEIRSLTASTVPIRWTAQEFFSAGTANYGLSTADTLVNQSTGAFITLAAGGTSIGEMQFYRIISSLNKYVVQIENFGDSKIHMAVEKNI